MASSPVATLASQYLQSLAGLCTEEAAEWDGVCAVSPHPLAVHTTHLWSLLHAEVLRHETTARRQIHKDLRLSCANLRFFAGGLHCKMKTTVQKKTVVVVAPVGHVKRFGGARPHVTEKQRRRNEVAKVRECVARLQDECVLHNMQEAPVSMEQCVREVPSGSVMGLALRQHLSACAPSVLCRVQKMAAVHSIAPTAGPAPLCYIIAYTKVILKASSRQVALRQVYVVVHN